MADDKLLHALASFSTGYVKRWMEGRYDQIMQTNPAQRLMQMNAPARYGIEAALYALMAFVDQRWQADSPLQKAVKSVVTDAPPELAKRLVNGFREGLVHGGRAASGPQEAAVRETLLSLDDAQLATMLKWYAETKQEDRGRLRRTFGGLSAEQMKRLTNLTEEQRNVLVELESPSTPAPKARPAQVQVDLDEAHRRLDEELRRIREKRKR